MERRKFLLGAGSLAAAGAAAMGTGAFGAASAEREATIQIVGDSNAYLQMTADPNSPVVNEVGGEIVFDFGANNSNGGNGLNSDAVTEFTNVLNVKNAGVDDLWLGVYLEDLKNDASFIDDANAYAHESPAGESLEYDGDYWTNVGTGFPPVYAPPPSATNSNVRLDAGTDYDISFQFNTNDEAPPQSIDSNIYIIGVERGGQYDQS